MAEPSAPSAKIQRQPAIPARWPTEPRARNPTIGTAMNEMVYAHAV
jgi:hypothetical protein